ncbi:VIT family-domain-containing protein [Exophiala viscosa]|uniref:VIT family-domain-containing protein n=1 Tax=Exophiala viscosa TaxID=2486360 RepID=A0AAN6E474_9EURO|nr:VIT family-domain-containing protein [Exophiala viscosa]KAI1629402.1 VIT family-domain-containing protein [Exophiala viscosa]
MTEIFSDISLLNTAPKQTSSSNINNMFNDSYEDANAMAAMVNFFKPTKYSSLPRDPEKEAQRKPLSKISEESSSETSSQTSAETVCEVGLPLVENEHRPVNARIVSDAIIGLSDGLTVPFALTAGLSALGDTKVVVLGGLAELIAGAISMGLGGYLGAKSEEDSYKATLRSTRSKVLDVSSNLSSEVTDVFAPYHLPPSTLKDFTHQLITSNSPEMVVDFLMRFQHGTPEPAASRAVICALTIATGYFMGGFVPLIPYFFTSNVTEGLIWSISVMVLALFAFGYVKTGVTDGWRGGSSVRSSLKSGAQMVVVGGAAAGCAMGVVRLFSSLHLL